MLRRDQNCYSRTVQSRAWTLIMRVCSQPGRYYSDSFQMYLNDSSRYSASGTTRELHPRYSAKALRQAIAFAALTSISTGLLRNTSKTFVERGNGMNYCSCRCLMICSCTCSSWSTPTSSLFIFLCTYGVEISSRRQPDLQSTSSPCQFLLSLLTRITPAMITPINEPSCLISLHPQAT